MTALRARRPSVQLTGVTRTFGSVVAVNICSLALDLTVLVVMTGVLIFIARRVYTRLGT